MAESPTGLMPEDLMYPQMRRQAKLYIIALPWPSENKRELLFGWAATVGVRLNASEVEAVVASGLDQRRVTDGTTK